MIQLKREPKSRVLLYTEATGKGLVAWVISGPKGDFFARTTAPGALWLFLQPRETQVGPFELAAAIAGIEAVLGMYSDCEVVLFIDNQTALGVILNGSCRERDMTELVKGLWFRCAMRGVFLSAFWVPSRLNIADSPTRPGEKDSAFRAMLEAGFVERPFVWPADVLWC